MSVRIEVSPLVDTGTEKDIFACGWVAEIVGPCVRLTLYADHNLCGGPRRERLVVGKVVLPIDRVPENFRRTLNVLDADQPTEIGDLLMN
jgi:hypothetical protein